MAVVSIKNKLRRGNLLVGNTAYDPAAMDSIATVTVGSGGSSYIEFTSIPNTYTHLQIRYLARTNRATYGVESFKINVGVSSADTGANYTRHYLLGDGSSVAAAADTSATYWEGVNDFGTTTGGSFGAGVIDILDYANTNKYKTMRKIGGVDVNGTVGGVGGNASLVSSVWMSTSAIGYIKIAAMTNTLQQYSHFALYGIASA
jgi:hypothetical protein